MKLNDELLNETGKKIMHKRHGQFFNETNLAENKMYYFEFPANFYTLVTISTRV